MIDPITFSATVLGDAIVNVGCGLMNNAMDSRGKAAWHRITGWWEQGKTPENHDVLRATHNAYVAAMRVMARAAKDIALSDEEIATAHALKKLCGEGRFHDFRWNGEHLPLDETRDKIDALLDRQRLEGEAAAWRAYNQSVLDDLTAWGIDRYPLFDTLFLDGVGHHVPWHLCFREQFAEIVKADLNCAEGERAFRVLTLEALAELKGMGAVVDHRLARIGEGVENIHSTQVEDRARDIIFQTEVLQRLEIQTGNSAFMANPGTLLEMDRSSMTVLMSDKLNQKQDLHKLANDCADTINSISEIFLKNGNWTMASKNWIEARSILFGIDNNRAVSLSVNVAKRLLDETENNRDQKAKEEISHWWQWIVNNSA